MTRRIRLTSSGSLAAALLAEALLAAEATEELTELGVESEPHPLQRAHESFDPFLHVDIADNFREFEPCRRHNKNQFAMSHRFKIQKRFYTRPPQLKPNRRGYK